MGILNRLSPRVRQVIDWIVGLTLIGIGIIGFVLPVLQGWLFVIMGLAVLSSHNRHAKAVYERLKSMGRSVRDKVAAHREGRRGRRENGSASDADAPSPAATAPPERRESAGPPKPGDARSGSTD